jgi:hypothetical protein
MPGERAGRFLGYRGKGQPPLISVRVYVFGLATLPLLQVVRCDLPNGHTSAKTGSWERAGNYA